MHALSITCADRGGLLFAIADVLIRHGITLYAAKIDTLGERVEDTFLIQGDALLDGEGARSLETELLGVLQD